MQLNWRKATRVAALGAFAVSGGVAQAQVTTTAFQNGLNGYTGTFDRRIADNVLLTPPDLTQEFNGSTVANFFVDGYAPDGTDGNTLPDSNDQQMLIRFDNLFGSGPGQIPSGATILDAKVTTTTSLRGNAQTSGPFGIAALNQPFSSSTTYTDFVSPPTASNFGFRGPWFQDGTATRAVGGWGFQNPGESNPANVTSLVQAWANGAPNHGFTIQAGISDDLIAAANTADGWAINSTGYPFADQRPRLSVTYTTNPITQRVFQRDLNGYTGDSMFVVRSGPSPLVFDVDPVTGLPAVDPVTLLPLERTEDGTALTQTFLDGPNFSLPDGTTDSPDDFGVFKFNNVFGAGANQSPADVPVAKAWLVLTTGDTGTSSQSSGPWAVHSLVRPIDATSLHSGLGTVGGVTVGDGDIRPELSRLEGVIRGSEAWFDVTNYLEDVRTGEITDNGLAVLANGTADGWQIHANGSAVAEARPRLVVFSGDLGVVAGSLQGDFNDDGVVDAADYTVYRDNLGTSFSLNGNGDETGASAGVVDAADLALFRARYGASVSSFATAVPEPASLGFVMATVMALAARRRI